MLFQFGPVTIDSPDGLNATQTAEEFGSDYAVKPVVGAAQNREFVGPSDHKFSLSGKLLPNFHWRHGAKTGLGEIKLLRGIANSGEPQILVRRDGTMLGFFLLEKVSQKSSTLGPDGMGKEIVWDMSLVESATATSTGGLLDLFESLFA